MRTIRSRIVTALLVIASALALSSCAVSRVGNERIQRNDAGVKSSEAKDYCDGTCLRFNDKGSCVSFNADISEICTRHMIRSAAINGDCNAAIFENSGIVNIDYSGCGKESSPRR